MNDKSILLNIKRISKRGLILPSIFILVIIILSMALNVQHIFSPPVITNTHNIDTLYHQNTQYVEYDIDTLYYTNYEYMSGDKVLGYYYYTIVDDRCTFVLISSKHLDSPVPELTYYSAKAKLTKAGPIHKQMLELLAIDLNWTVEGITESSSSILINELEYHELGYFLLLFAILILIAVSIFILFTNLLYLIKPILHPSCLLLKKYGDVHDLIRKADREMQSNLRLMSGNTFLTDNFIIDLSYMSVIILPIEQIIWAYEHTKWHKLFWIKLKLNYTLNIIAKYKVKVSLHENTKDDINIILELIHQKHPQILIGFTKDNKKAIKQISRPGKG